jgi:PKD repeat protein
MKKGYSFLMALIFGTVGTLSAQHQHDFKCAEHHKRAEQIQKHPDVLQWEAYQDAFIADFIRNNNLQLRDSSVVYTIPVVFHLIHQYGIENIPNENIYNQIAILNRDYNKQNADTADVVLPFRSIVADCKFQFKLATIDPLGNCTNGIDRIASTLTYVGNDIAKLNPWPRHKYLNVWVINDMEDGVAGYAYRPSGVADASSAWQDGIIIRYDYIGSLPPAAAWASRALTHEIGHWLDLAHTWGGTNEPEVECGDDNVEDTPPTAGHNNCGNTFDNECDNVVLPLMTDATQTAYKFASVNNTTGTSDPSTLPYVGDSVWTATGMIPSLVFGPFTANGVSAQPETTGSFGFSGWGTGATDQNNTYANMTGAINTNQYYEFTLSNDSTQLLSLTGITLDVQRSTHGPRCFAIRSSVNNFSSNLAAVITPANPALTVQSGNVLFFATDVSTNQVGSKINLSGPGFNDINDGNVTFRIYAWNAESTAGNFAVDNVNFTGSYGTIENVQNYMEYSYCSVMFTNGQKNRMIGSLNSPVANRMNLSTPENLEATGTDGIHDLVCAPTADFYPSSKIACEGNAITFYDYSSDATATSWSWTFQDATPATSTSQNPSVTFTSGGWKSVTLTATNAVGSTTTTNTMAIYVTPNWPEMAGIMQENCNVNPITQHAFQAYNLSGNESNWNYSTASGYKPSGSEPNGCVVLNNNDVPVNLLGMRGYDVDELITPSMDLSLLSNGKLSFRYAYATGGTTLTDATETLEIWSSRTCGEDWQFRTSLDATDLVTAGSYSDDFVPNGNTHWVEKQVTIPSTYETNNVRFKFVFTSSFSSNHLYLDDINILGTVNVNEFDKARQIQLFPNPVGEMLNVQLPAQGVYSRLNVRDISGRIVSSQSLNGAAQSSQIQVSTAELSSGMYLLELVGTEGVISREFMKGTE